MKKKTIRIAGIAALAFGLFFTFQTEVVGHIFHDIFVVDGDATGGPIDSSLLLVDGGTEDELDLEDFELPVAEDFVQETEGTIIEVKDGEFLFVQKLDLSTEELAMTFDQWLASDYSVSLMRLTGIEAELEVGMEIAITYTMATFSIPPVVPVQSYEIIG